MTTIAFDGKILAADSRMIGSHIVQTRYTKLFRHKGIIWGFCGDTQYAPIFERWVKAGMRHDAKPKIREDSEFAVLLIKKGRAYYYTDEFEATPAGVPAAIGSGGDYAIAAMLGGANARRSVQIASRLDPNTGGHITVVTA